LSAALRSDPFFADVEGALHGFARLSNGKIPPAGLKPHDDLLAQFPYLGPPNP
jgi:hypothetical protein